MFLNSLNVNVHLPIISESQILWQVWQLETGVRFCSASERSLAFPSSSPLQSPAWPGRQCGCKVSAQDFSGCLIVLGLNHKVAVRINSHQCASIRPFQTYWKWNLFNPKYQKLTQFLKRREKILQHGYDQEQGKSQKTQRCHFSSKPNIQGHNVVKQRSLAELHEMEHKIHSNHFKSMLRGRWAEASGLSSMHYVRCVFRSFAFPLCSSFMLFQTNFGCLGSCFLGSAQGFWSWWNHQ